MLLLCEKVYFLVRCDKVIIGLKQRQIEWGDGDENYQSYLAGAVVFVIINMYDIDYIPLYAID